MRKPKLLPPPFRDEGMKLLGEVLKDLRLKADRSVDFLSSPPARLSVQMVRMIEGGWSDIPVAKVPAYASALSSDQALVDAGALWLASASLRNGATPSGRFNWPALCAGVRAEGKQYLFNQLTMPPPYVVGQPAETSTELDALNPIQRQLVVEIARRVTAFGSNVVTDTALAAWESQNKENIRRVLAVTTSLGSEFSSYTSTIPTLIREPEFKGVQYLIASEDAQAVGRAFNAFRREIVAQMLEEATSKSDIAPTELARSRLEYRHVSLEQFSDIERQLRPKDESGWSALYLYELVKGDDLLIGVFRRVPSITSTIPPISLREWGAIPMNEALPHRAAQSFKSIHQMFWKSDKRQAGPA